MRPHSLAILIGCALPLIAVVALAMRSFANEDGSAQAPATLGAAGTANGTIAVGADGRGLDIAATIPTSGPLSGLPARIADRALARAYAAVGRAEMGDGQALAQLDDQARARIDEARALLAAQPLIHRLGSGAAGSSAGRAAQDEASAGGTLAAAAAPTHGLVLDLSHAVDPSSALRNTPSGPVLIQPGLWAKASFDPNTQRQMVVSDASGGDGYAVSLFASDYSTVRLDGGLVVPGRYYQVSGSSVITGAVPCTVDIRPLSALGSYAPAPARPPQSNG